MNNAVTLTVENHIAQVRLNREDKLNSFNLDLIQGLIDTAAAIEADKSVRVVVMAGAGRCFSAGIDVKGLLGQPGAAEKLLSRTPDHDANLVQQCVIAWRDLSAPVITALHGYAFGAGFQLAMAADIRIAQADTELSIMEIRWGIIPDMGVSTILPTLINQDVAKLLTFTGQRISASTGLGYGLVTQLADDPLAVANELATTIAGNNPDAIRAGKQLINNSWSAPRAEALLMEEQLQLKVLAGANQKEAMMAGMEKRTPVFKDPE